jgi:hypothetical protein
MTQVTDWVDFEFVFEAEVTKDRFQRKRKRLSSQDIAGIARKKVLRAAKMIAQARKDRWCFVWRNATRSVAHKIQEF